MKTIDDIWALLAPEGEFKRRLEMSYDAYYGKYGTTEERDGWKMENPTGRQVIYVKAG